MVSILLAAAVLVLSVQKDVGEVQPIELVRLESFPSAVHRLTDNTFAVQVDERWNSSLSEDESGFLDSYRLTSVLKAERLNHVGFGQNHPVMIKPGGTLALLTKVSDLLKLPTGLSSPLERDHIISTCDGTMSLREREVVFAKSANEVASVVSWSPENQIAGIVGDQLWIVDFSKICTLSQYAKDGKLQHTRQLKWKNGSVIHSPGAWMTFVPVDKNRAMLFAMATEKLPNVQWRIDDSEMVSESPGETRLTYVGLVTAGSSDVLPIGQVPNDDGLRHPVFVTFRQKAVYLKEPSMLVLTVGKRVIACPAKL